MFFSFHSPVVVFLQLFAISAMYNVRSPLWSVGYIMFWLLCRVWAHILHHGRPQAGSCRHPAAPPTEVNSDLASFLVLRKRSPHLPSRLTQMADYSHEHVCNTTLI